MVQGLLGLQSDSSMNSGMFEPYLGSVTGLNYFLWVLAEKITSFAEINVQNPSITRISLSILATQEKRVAGYIYVLFLGSFHVVKGEK